MSSRAIQFFKEQSLNTPCIVLDLDIVETNYRRLLHYLPFVDVFYAVKAQSNTEVLERLSSIGSNFDVASIRELNSILSIGVHPDRISFGNTNKKASDIKKAFEAGVRMFVFDSEPELKKIAMNAPGAKVFCRILHDGTSADWPLSRKFGCEHEMAADLMVKAKELGLIPYGISGHPGSQQNDPNQWHILIAAMYELILVLRREGIEIDMINLGGGLPAYYRSPIPGFETFAEMITGFLAEHFGEQPDWPRIIMEPGRSIAADAGTMFSEVVNVTKKSYDEFERRWVFLDVGKFNGLAEVMDESIKFRIVTDKDGEEDGPVIIADCTCDSAGVSYQKTEYRMPLSLAHGDIVQIRSAGAYTDAYGAGAWNGSECYGGFNGFPPPSVHIIGQRPLSVERNEE